MKLHSWKHIVCAGLLLGSTLAALAVPVTFQVNMSYQTSLGNFNPAADQVEARGAFQSPSQWTGGFVLTNSPADTNVYSGTYDVTAATAGTALEYKFVILVGGTNANWETLQNNTSGNRQFTLAGSDQTLPVAYYADTWDGPPISVTFQVDMGVQTAVGRFDPAASDYVEARGTFQTGSQWSGGFALASTPDNTNLYVNSYDVVLAPGATVNYKFVINSSVWENDPNRTFTLAYPTQLLSAVYFNNVSGFPIQAAILFQVDMNVQTTTGNFDKTSDEVYVRGNQVGWGGPPDGLQLLEDTTRPGIYTNVWSATNFVTGDQFQYKFTIWRPATSATVWEDGDNKVVVFSGSEPVNPAGYHQVTVGPVYFNNVSPSDVLAQDTLVTFQVNMTNAVALGTPPVPFDPSTQAVYINGAFVPWWAWHSLPAAYLMYDDGSTDGDAKAGDLIYTWQQLFTKGSPARVEYKYGIDSSDNEAGFNVNHVRYINSHTGTYVMPLDTFGSMYQEPVVGTLSISRQPGQVTLTWNGRPGIHLQSVDSLTNPSWQDVADSDGLSAKTVQVGTNNAYYRLVKP